MEHDWLQNQVRLRREVLMRRVLDTLRQTVKVVPLDVTMADAAAEMRVEMTEASARVIAPLLEAVEILEAIVWSSDGCVGHKYCVHSMEPWERARALLDGKWEAEADPLGERWPDPAAGRRHDA